MKTLIFLLAMLFVLTSTAFSWVWVSGYVKSNGTYVAPYARTDADGYKFNNWSSKGNVNPITGTAGTKSWSWTDDFSTTSTTSSSSSLYSW